jgi:hypothetical protein
MCSVSANTQPSTMDRRGPNTSRVSLVTASVQRRLTFKRVHLSQICDKPHEIAACQSQHASRPNQAIAGKDLVSHQSSITGCARAHVWLGPLGVANHDAAIIIKTRARMNTVGREDDMSGGGGGCGTSTNAQCSEWE